MTAPSHDLAVIGDGVIGLSIAFEAARRGQRVAVLGKARAGAATCAAGGMLTPGSEANTLEPELIALAKASCRAYPDFVAAVEDASGMSCGYRSEGTLCVALHRDHVTELQHLARQQERLGLHSEWLTSARVRDLEPSLSPRQIGALWIAGDHQVNPMALHAALGKAVLRQGADVVASDEILALTRGVHYRRDGRDAVILAKDVVVAAGSFSNDLPEIHLPLRPVRGQFVRLQGEPLFDHVIRTPDVYLIPRADGEVYVGATQEEVGFDGRVMAGAVMDLLNDAWRVVPGIYEMSVLATGYGFRPASRDNLPLLGPTGTPGVHVATGHYRHGIMLAPITAQLMVDYLQGGHAPALMEPFGLHRFDGPTAEAKK
jgi:glycine oxidase